jgi:hypothetical protein
MVNKVVENGVVAVNPRKYAVLRVSICLLLLLVAVIHVGVLKYSETRFFAYAQSYLFINVGLTKEYSTTEVSCHAHRDRSFQQSVVGNDLSVDTRYALLHSSKTIQK